MTAVLDVATRSRHVYGPRGACLEAMHCRDGELLLSGPAGTGKSRALLEKLHAIMLANPGARGLIVRQVRDTLSSTGLVTWREYVAKEALEAGVLKYYGGSGAEPPQYRYRNGSLVMLAGMDRPTKIMSSEYDMIYVQEGSELTAAGWQALTTRLRNGRVSFQQIMADTNPDVPTHWLYQRFRGPGGSGTMLDTRHEDNPRLYADDGTLTTEGAAYIARLDRLTGVRRERLRYGRWVAAEGLVYEEWDPTLHLRKIADPPHDWPRYWAVDFGYTNPLVIQCWALDPDDRLHLYRELYRTGLLVEDAAKIMLKAVRRAACPECRGRGEPDRPCLAGHDWLEPRPREVICDHDAEDRATLERHLDMGTTPARKSVADGIQAVKARLRPAGDGRPRIHLSPTALMDRDPGLSSAGRPLCTIDEVPGYVWDRGGTTAVAAGKPPKEAPVKADDHGLDAMRYMVAHLDLRPNPRVRWL